MLRNTFLQFAQFESQMRVKPPIVDLLGIVVQNGGIPVIQYQETENKSSLHQL